MHVATATRQSQLTRGGEGVRSRGREGEGAAVADARTLAGDTRRHQQASRREAEAVVSVSSDDDVPSRWRRFCLVACHAMYFLLRSDQRMVSPLLALASLP